METTLNIQTEAGKEKASFYRWAAALAVITIVYNLAEGAVSVILGSRGGTVTLFGFGVDSFVEVISGIGIWHMVRRMRQNGQQGQDMFERNALRLTGCGFYILTAALAATSLLNILGGHKPETTFWGVVVSFLAIIAMWTLIHFKVKAGRRFNSQALLADAACSRACLYLSFVLLAASVGYELTGVGVFDSLGALGIAFFSFKEGREAFEKAKGKTCGCGGKSCGQAISL